jgi:hypothetical protein
MLKRSGHVTLFEEKEIRTGFWWGNLKEGLDFEDLDIHGRVILKWILK